MDKPSIQVALNAILELKEQYIQDQDFDNAAKWRDIADQLKKVMSQCPNGKEFTQAADCSEVKLIETINKLGNDGWELVSVCFQEKGNRFVAFLKRNK